jgi:hypothetical protein
VGERIAAELAEEIRAAIEEDDDADDADEDD